MRNDCSETDMLSYFIETINSGNYLFLTNNYGLEVLVSETFNSGFFKQKPVNDNLSSLSFLKKKG